MRHAITLKNSNGAKNMCIEILVLIVGLATLISTIIFEVKHIKEADRVLKKRIIISATPTKLLMWKSLCSGRVISGTNKNFSNKSKINTLKIGVLMKLMGCEYVSKIKFENLKITNQGTIDTYPKCIVDCLQTEFLPVEMLDTDYLCVFLSFQFDSKYLVAIISRLNKTSKMNLTLSADIMFETFNNQVTEKMYKIRNFRFEFMNNKFANFKQKPYIDLE